MTSTSTPAMEMPLPETYSEGLDFWPFRTALQVTLDRVITDAPKGGSLADMMCGTADVLGKIAQMRPDLTLLGVDSEEKYIAYNKKTYPGISFERGDVRTWCPRLRYDVVICTGAIHHLSDEDQEPGIANIAWMVKPGGSVIISDCYIADYNTDSERKAAAAQLGLRYLKETRANGAPEHVMKWTKEILWNDLALREYKTSLAKRLPVLEAYFSKVETVKTWPLDRDAGYGEYVHLCSFV